MFILKKMIKKLYLLFLVLFKKNLKIDFKSEIKPFINWNNIKGNKKSIIIQNSFLSDRVIMGEGCKINNVICSGHVKLGDFVSLNGPATRLSSRVYGIEIGSFTSIASNVVIQEDYHRIDKVSTYFMNQNIFYDTVSNDIYSKGKIKIEEDVWIGSNSSILSGVTIGRGSIIGAGSVVTKDIPKYSIVAGNPAKVIKLRFSEYVIEELERSRWWEFEIDTIRELKNDFNKDLSKDSNVFKEVLKRD